MQLLTDHTRCIGTDATNGTVHFLIPRGSNLTVEHLRLDDHDRESIDAAESKLLEQEITVFLIDPRFDLPSC